MRILVRHRFSAPALLAIFLLESSPAAAEPRVLIPSVAEESTTWHYTTDNPGEGWTKPDFDDSNWVEGKAGFGVTDQVTPHDAVGTPWRTSSIWLRKSIDVSGPVKFTKAGLIVRHDEDTDVYVNGALVFAVEGYNTKWMPYDVTKELKPVLQPGKNCVAVHCRQTTGGQYIDVGLVLDPKEKLSIQADPMAVAELQKLRDARWPVGTAWEWYAEVGPIAGCNYVPRTAVNTTEMWQKETFDPNTIDEELGWAERCGINSVRVFVQYIVYEDDPDGLIERMDQFLAIAAKHKISVMFILFDDCFKPEPKLGKQRDPVPGVHNSQWTSSPGNRRKQPDYWPKLEKYVKHVVGHFANDERVLVWDLYNEAKKSSRPLLLQAFKWARAARPSQPLTSCWQAADVSDVITFHDYGKPNPDGLAQLRAERPAICTECIARSRGSTFEAVLPAYAEQGIGWYMWGLVQGRIQTYYPWGSSKGGAEPNPWFHDLLRPDGMPYRAEEIELIRNSTGQFKRSVPTARWSAEKAWEWYAEIEPIFGCNYLPRTAVNMTEMWQKETFDPKTIDEELGWAEKAGYNSLRVFVQYLVWKDDPDGLKERIDQFLTIADRHGIRVMLMPFCDCAFAGRGPYLGKQDEPVPGVHNSGWVPSPGHGRVNDRSTWPDLERYAKDLIGHFRADRRVLIWDLYNEPGMSGQGEKSLPLVVAAFRWAREAKPTQPVTVGAYTNLEDRMSKTMLGLSDVVSFHGYDAPEGVRRKVNICRQFNRPILCTEWLVRGRNNRFETILPIFAQERVGGYHWGLVAGRTQTYMPWGSKRGDPMPELWHHDVFRSDGTPYDPAEIKLIREFRLLGSSHRTIVPTSEEMAQTWYYTTSIPNYGWHLPNFDPSAPWKGVVWQEGPGGFGTRETPNTVVGTDWDTQNIWLRRTFDLDGEDLRRPHLRIRHDEHAEVYINGHLAAKMTGSNTDYQLVPVSRMAHATLHAGTNLIAVHCRQTSDGQYVDVGLVDVLPGSETAGLAAPDPPAPAAPPSAGTPWPAERARVWYATQPPIRGCNYLPRTAINSVEMWRKETFDRKTIDEELGWAAAAGYNSVRVFLQYVVWADDPQGFAERFETFLHIADKHGITTMPIFFDDVCFAMKLEPILGPQDEPIYGIHNSGWVPSPGYSMVQDHQQWPPLETFVKDIVRRHGRDRRVIVWDIYNEPGPYFDRTLSFPLAKAAMGWVRELQPIQPVTIGVWANPQSRQFVPLSDVPSLHTYGGGGIEEFFLDAREKDSRPALVTECLARPAFGFDTMLPLFARHHVGWYNWGLVAGRTQTNRGWASKQGDPRPTLWHHDVLRPDGTPYDATEIELIRSFAFDDREPQIVVPTSRREAQVWHWSTDRPADDWFQPAFDDAGWQSGPGAFGTKGLPGSAVRTAWKSSDIWLRRSFELKNDALAEPQLQIRHDEDAEVFINGRLAAKVSGYNTYHALIPIAREAAETLRAGTNVLAVHCRQTTGGQYIDVGIVTLKKVSRWSRAKVWKWYNDQPWPCGFNYIPADAINSIEMWMPYAYDADLIDKELRLAEENGFNCLRVFLPFVVWEHHPDTFKKRLDSFLSICDKHGIRVMMVLFDDCVFGSDEKLKNPTYGHQPEVLKGWYANGWAPSPGQGMVRDHNAWPRLEEYVTDVISKFKDDGRVWVWDLYNEPTNSGLGNTSVPLVEKVFHWARKINPSQPLTVGQWNDNAALNAVIYRNSDIMTFHDYGAADHLAKHIASLAKHGRPIINTEWLNRGRGSLVETCLPVFAEEKVGCMHWGLVNGKTQTHLPWGHRPGDPEPKVWQHDLYHPDHRPYDTTELELFRKSIRESETR